MGVLEYFSLYLAAIVVFRVTFAVLHTIKWRWRYAFNKKYAISEYNLERTFKDLKKTARTGGESTDDEMMEEEAEKIFRKHEGTIKERANRTGGFSGLHDISTNKGQREAALDFIYDNDVKQKDDDDSEGELEFDNAAIEEVED